jgi:hypothetical protein
MQTDSSISPFLYISEFEPGTGYIVRATYTTIPPTTASKFAIGALVMDRNTGVEYKNIGTVAVPVWDAGSITKIVSLTAAEINTLYSVGKEIIPAVTGKIIVLEDFVFDLTGTVTQFASGGVVNLQYDTTIHGAGTTLHADIAASVVTGATARVITERIPKDLSAIATAGITSLPVWIGAKTADFTTGTGTAVIRVKYHLVG